MTTAGLLFTVAHVSVSHAIALDRISSVRPLQSIFHPALFCSLLGQFAVHVLCMRYAVDAAKVWAGGTGSTGGIAIVAASPYQGSMVSKFLDT